MTEASRARPGDRPVRVGDQDLLKGFAEGTYRTKHTDADIHYDTYPHT